MLTHPKILFWGAYNFEKIAKNGVPECRGHVIEAVSYTHLTLPTNREV